MGYCQVILDKRRDYQWDFVFVLALFATHSYFYFLRTFIRVICTDTPIATNTRIILTISSSTANATVKLNIVPYIGTEYPVVQ